MTDQVWRSSRLIGANISEAWAKRKYPAHFLSKLSDADGELQETSHWLSTALTCRYITSSEHFKFEQEIETLGGMLGRLIQMPEKFVPKE